MAPHPQRVYRKHRTSEDDDDGGAEGESAGADADIVRDALHLRKLRRKFGGLDAHVLNAGDPVALETEQKEEADKQADAGTIGAFSKSTAQTVMDPTKHMQKYIESQLKQRQSSADPDSTKPDTLAGGDTGAGGGEGDGAGVPDPNELLYQIPDHLKITSKPVQEGNVTLSTTMLTAIPEIDLGIDAKLKNIEATEKAKKKLKEDKGKGANPEAFVGSSEAAADRFLRQTHPSHHTATSASPFHPDPDSAAALDRRRREARERREGVATDEVVMERFKKRRGGRR
ncbi:hypothetical protein M427DRAFT_75447 [Gonapodya prolifera JEL478]|uniref:Hepatocellular carcinoma-associated antigen 59-domain-containing protein n=1 Tax=Gonapodya prolifera (strain JEL478) TaxID=1344416 RepID=A0A138ZYT1_GONPJ|nr:hypothetical protein M427DRAFT_75447 [Gonapodya prolifera JEL478]|eukprot:KXS09435.1 hypothetical protein M427DRAFT_75447 [Gonapodya prolifera JEL478]